MTFAQLYRGFRGIVSQRQVKNSIVYALVAIFQKAIGFLLLPVYTAFLTPREYGIVYLANTIVGFYGVIFTLSLYGAAGRFYFKYQDDKEMTRVIWGTCATFAVLNSVFLSIVIGAFHRILLDPLAEGVSFVPFLLLALVSSGIATPYKFYQAKLQTEQASKSYGLNSIIFFVINVGLNIVLLVVLRWKATGILTALVISNALFFFYAVFKLASSVRIRLDFGWLKRTLSYSLPLVPYNLAAYISAMIDRVLLNNMRSTATVGIYSVGFQFSGLMNLITTAVGQAYSPWFYIQIEKGESGRRLIAQVVPVLISAFVIGGALVSYLTPLAMTFMVSAEFRSAWSVVPLLSFGSAAYGAYILLSNGFFVVKTYYLPAITIIGGVINIALNFLLIPRLGMWGASVSNAVFNAAVTIVLLFLVEKVEPIGYRKMDLAVPFLLFAGFSLVQPVVHERGTAFYVVVDFILIAGMAAAVCWINRKSLKLLLGVIMSRRESPGAAP